MFNDKSRSPWQTLPAAKVLMGRSVELALSQEAGEPVSIDAFEVGSIMGSRTPLKIAGMVLLSPLWVALLILMSFVLIFPSWIYIPYLTWRDWDDAKRVGVSSSMMILKVVIIFPLGIIGGLMMTLELIGKLGLIENMVVVARVKNSVALLCLRIPWFNYPKFSAIEYLQVSHLRLEPSSSVKHVVLVAESTGEIYKIIVRRMSTWQTGTSQQTIIAANLKILIGLDEPSNHVQ